MKKRKTVFKATEISLIIILVIQVLLLVAIYFFIKSGYMAVKLINNKNYCDAAKVIKNKKIYSSELIQDWIDKDMNSYLEEYFKGTYNEKTKEFRDLVYVFIENNYKCNEDEIIENFIIPYEQQHLLKLINNYRSDIGLNDLKKSAGLDKTCKDLALQGLSGNENFSYVFLNNKRNNEMSSNLIYWHMYPYKTSDEVCSSLVEKDSYSLFTNTDYNKIGINMAYDEKLKSFYWFIQIVK